jgi:hypothetical protein
LTVLQDLLLLGLNAGAAKVEAAALMETADDMGSSSDEEGDDEEGDGMSGSHRQEDDDDGSGDMMEEDDEYGAPPKRQKGILNNGNAQSGEICVSDACPRRDVLPGATVVTMVVIESVTCSARVWEVSCNLPDTVLEVQSQGLQVVRVVAGTMLGFLQYQVVYIRACEERHCSLAVYCKWAHKMGLSKQYQIHLK